MNLLITGTDFPPNKGGISTYTRELAAALAKTNQVTVLAPGAFEKNSFDQMCPYRIIRTPANPIMRFTGFFIYVPWLIWRYHIDAVLHTVWITSLISHLWYWLMPVSYFISVHASEILDDKRTWRRRAKGYLKRWRHAAIRRAKGLFPVSRYSARLLMDLGMVKKNQICVITNGVDPQRFRPAQRDRGRKEEKTLLTVSRLDLHKGHDRVLEALAILKEQGLRPHYIIVGEGEEERRLRDIVRNLGLEAQVRFTGSLPENELPAIYANSDIFIMVSREIPGRLDLIEGFGISFLEASASGLPVVAGRSGGVPDAVRDGETGILVNPDDPKEISEAIRLLLTDKKLARRLGNKGRKWTETEMNWGCISERLCYAMLRLM